MTEQTVRVLEKKPRTRCTCTNVRRAARMLTQAYDAAIKPSGLKVTQLSVLWALRRLGPVNAAVLSREVQLDRTTLVRNLALLQRARLIVSAHGKDDRERVLHLTAAGERALDRAIPLWTKVQSKLSANLGQRRLAKLESLLVEIESLVPEEK
jgi:DNA-binding MarR family transcriptional regulator